MDILYLCDGKACEVCCPEACDYTRDISHARNFEKNPWRNIKGEEFYVEKDTRKLKRVKVIRTDYKSSIFEEKVNDKIAEIEKNGFKVFDIQFRTEYSHSNFFYTAMIVYGEEN